MNLIEKYKRRLAVSEQVYAQKHENEKLSESKKACIARVLANTSAFLSESFNNSVGTQRADMGEFKKFALDLTTVAVPNLIAHDLVLVHPMSSITGYIQYIEFVSGTNKGGVKQGDVFNNPFRLGDMNKDREQFTSNAIVEPITETFLSGAYVPAWGPVVKGVFTDKEGVKKDVKVIKKGESTPYFGTIDAEGHVVVEGGLKAGDRVAYAYNNVIVPQDDLPILNVKISSIALEAKARRIAIYYSQMAAFQAKQEMGIGLGDILATQACAELDYEIDTEVVNLLAESAPTDKTVEFNKRVPAGVSKAEHYDSFNDTLAEASQIIYDRTKKHAANYMVCASNVIRVLGFLRGWKPASTGKINGPYFAGTINSLKVYVTPSLAPDTFFLGFNGDDLMTSAAVFAPYMAVVPTQLLGYADGGMSQGFSTMYDLKLLNPALLVSGKIVDKDQVIVTKQAA